MKDVRPLLYNVLLLVFLAMLVYGLWSASRWEWYHFVVCIVAAGFVALLGNMDRLESFKAGAGGIEAKTREVVKQAENAISELQQLGETLASVLYEVIEGGSRWGGSGSEEHDARKAELLHMLEVIGVSEDRRERVRLSDRKWVLIDYTNGIAGGLPSDPRQNQAWSETWGSYQGPARPSPEELRRMLAPFTEFEAWREALMQDYEHYWRAGTHRRPHIWAKRDEWHAWTQDGSWPAS